MGRVKIMGDLWDRTTALTGAGSQTQTDEQQKVFRLLAEFMDTAAPPLRTIPTLADLLIAAYEVGRASANSVADYPDPSATLIAKMEKARTALQNKTKRYRTVSQRTSWWTLTTRFATK